LARRLRRTEGRKPCRIGIPMVCLKIKYLEGCAQGSLEGLGSRFCTREKQWITMMQSTDLA